MIARICRQLDGSSHWNKENGNARFRGGPSRRSSDSIRSGIKRGWSVRSGVKGLCLVLAKEKIKRAVYHRYEPNERATIKARGAVPVERVETPPHGV